MGVTGPPGHSGSSTEASGQIAGEQGQKQRRQGHQESFAARLCSWSPKHSAFHPTSSSSLAFPPRGAPPQPGAASSKTPKSQRPGSYHAVPSRPWARLRHSGCPTAHSPCTRTLQGIWNGRSQAHWQNQEHWRALCGMQGAPEGSASEEGSRARAPWAGHCQGRTPTPMPGPRPADLSQVQRMALGQTQRAEGITCQRPCCHLTPRAGTKGTEWAGASKPAADHPPGPQLGQDSQVHPKVQELCVS